MSSGTMIERIAQCEQHVSWSARLRWPRRDQTKEDQEANRFHRQLQLNQKA